MRSADWITVVNACGECSSVEHLGRLRCRALQPKTLIYGVYSFDYLLGPASLESLRDCIRLHTLHTSKEYNEASRLKLR